MELVIPDCSWKELEDRLLGPACDRSKIQTNLTWLGLMKEHFRKSGFNFTEAVDLLKDESVENDVKKITELAINGQWIVLKCMNSERVEAIQKTLPIVYSLTTKKTSLVITTSDLIALFRQPWQKDEDGLLQHESVRQVEVIKSGGLLMWEKINAIVPGAVKFSGYFDGVLKEYARKGGAVVATMVHWKARPDNEKLLGEIAASVGDVVAYYFLNHAKFLNVGENK